MKDPDSRELPRQQAEKFAAFDIPQVDFPAKDELVEKLAVLYETSSSPADEGGDAIRLMSPDRVEAGLAVIATQAWKARAKMVDKSGEPIAEMRRVYRHLEGILAVLHDLGLQIKDHTGEAFDYGLPLKVVTSQPAPGIARETVIETIKPTIYWQQQIIQTGEVVIATPA